MWINGKGTDPLKLVTNEIYYHCLYLQKIPNCIDSWNRLLGKENNWNMASQNIIKSIQGKKTK